MAARRFRITLLHLILASAGFLPPGAAHASWVYKSCVSLLSTIGGPLIESRLTKYDRLRRMVVESPESMGFREQIDSVIHLDKSQRAVLRDLRSGSNAELLRAAASDIKIWPSLWRRWKLGRKMRVSYVMTALSLFGIGLAQPYILPAEVHAETTELRADEFEISFAALHTFIRVGKHSYDYMVSEMRRDGTGSYNDQALQKVRVRLTVDEINKLHDFLESEVGSIGVYYIYPLLGTNCLSNLLRAVNKTTNFFVPPGIKNSPTLTLAFFKITKYMGDRRVTAIELKPGRVDTMYSPDVIQVGDALFAAMFLSNNVVTTAVDYLPNGWTVRRVARDRE